MPDPYDPDLLAQSVRRLLDQGLMHLAPPRTANPPAESLVFFGSVPSELLRARYHALRNDMPTGCWYVFTEACDGSWLDAARGDFGLTVGICEDTAKIEEIRRSFPLKGTS